MELWPTEWHRLAYVCSVGLILGYLTGYYGWCFALAFGGYAVWQILQANQLNRWLSDGASLADAPSNGGAWEAISQAAHVLQQQAERRERRLQHRLRWYNKSASLLPDATLVLGDERRILWCNRRCEALLGIKRPRDIGIPLSNLWRDPALLTHLQNAEPGEELELPSPQQNDNILLVRGVPYGGGNTLLSVRDISQRVRLRRVRRAFIDNASHELRTPLTVLLGYLELFQSHTFEPELQQHLASMQSQGRQMQQTVEDLLLLSRVEHTRLNEADGEWIDVEAALTRRLEELKACGQIGQHHIVLDSSSAQLCGRIQEVSSIWDNLIVNALRHSPANSTVRITWQHSAEGAQLAVHDNGPAISAEHISRLTERFYRVDPARSRQSGGTGLGLAIVKHTIQRHGGQLIVNSDAQGNHFIAEFPAYRCREVHEHATAR